MTLEQAFVAIVTVMYGIVGISYAVKGNLPWSLVWISYASANIGLLWAAYAPHR